MSDPRMPNGWRAAIPRSSGLSLDAGAEWAGDDAKRELAELRDEVSKIAGNWKVIEQLQADLKDVRQMLGEALQANERLRKSGANDGQKFGGWNPDL